MANTARKPWLDFLAAALKYPDERTAENCARARLALPEVFLDMQQALTDLEQWLNGAAHGQPEEWYSRLFDLNPDCTLNIGYHLFGEQYERGAFLAGLVSEHRKVGLGVPDDLPDYLPAILRLLARVEELEDAQTLVSHALLPALSRMKADLAKSDAPWVPVLMALPAALETTFDTVSIPEEMYPTRDKTFLGKRELPAGSTHPEMDMKRRGRHV
jgi:nitrate reductase molybdenum cofactor assembly chaperone